MKTIIYKNKTITFIPTAHVSKESIKEVEAAITELRPDAVCIELDTKRAKSLLEPNKYKEVNIKEILKNGQTATFLANLILSSYQKRLASELDTEVGGEMIQAITSAKEVDASIHYIDRDINITMKRLWNGLGLFKKVSLASTLLLSVFEDDSIDEAQIEDLKQSDLLFEAMKEMDDKLPEVSQQILHERNYYMAEKLKRIPGETIVCVIGAAHLDGIIEALDAEHSINQLNILPTKKKNYGGWIIPIAMILILGFITLQNPQIGLNKLILWLSLSSALAALGSLIALAHPLTILVAVLSAPISALSPVLAVSMFTGITQAYVRPPTIRDFETVSQDISSLKKWYSNRLLKILLVALLSNILASMATIIAGSSILSSLF